MDDQLFAHFVSRLRFTENTRLRLYHNDHDDQSTLGDDWHSEDEIRRKVTELVSEQFLLRLRGRSKPAFRIS